MTYERYDVGPTQSGVRHTAPNVDRVMGLGSTQETTVDRLLTVVERLTAELATTQSALHDLALEVARAGLGSGAGAGRQAPAVGYGSGVSAISSGTVPLASNHQSSLPPRRSDHAVIPEIDSYTPGQTAAQQHDPYAPIPPAASDHNGGAPAATPLDEGLEPASADGAGPDAPHQADVATRGTEVQQRAAEASAAAAASVAAAAAAHQAAAAQPVDPHAAPGTGPAATYGGPTTPPAAAQAGFSTAEAPAPRTDLVASLNDVQLLSAGAVDVMIGPVRDLADLDALENRILALQSVEAVTVMAFEGRDVLVKIEIERPLPLASMLRTELGRPVDSCRLVEGRIVVTFADAEPVA
jgi:hypothetical protein